VRAMMPEIVSKERLLWKFRGLFKF
jgi:hypothetical protein